MNIIPGMHSIAPSKDHGQLLDVIDLLRSQGIDRHVRLPQLIVCGDQSSGKSSVLEAVSGVRFPTKDTLCTRFATELILRRGPSANVDIKIRPSQERSDEEKKRLADFKAPTTNIDDFPRLIEAAKEAMGLNPERKAFSEDILRIELSGPEQPHLTLVDLPGLFHSPNKQQSAQDAILVKSLARSYMANERSIILAVVSAKNDYANQVVTDLAREVDPRGARTLGIITKPDTLIVGSEGERSFRDLAKNEDVTFRLGWHVLRNRDFDTKDQSVDERDRDEREFFSKGIWTSLPVHLLGISALKPRLSIILRDQITSVLPSLIHDVESGIADCQDRLRRLGEARGTPNEQRLYLVRVGQTFSSFVKAAIDGVYTPDFFGDAMNAEGYSKRLRAVIQDLLLQFAEIMSVEGRQRAIIDEDSLRKTELSEREISRPVFIDNVVKLMKRSRGRELPGTFNPLIVGDLFYQQSKPWKTIVDRYSDKIIDATRTSMEMAVAASADATTCEGLLHELLYPALSQYSKALREKVAEIMRPHQQGHPITYNHYFIETVQKARQAHEKKRQARQLNIFFKVRPEAGPSYISSSTGFNTGDLLNALHQSTEADMDRHACSEAVDCMEAYYQVSILVGRFWLCS